MSQVFRLEWFARAGFAARGVVYLALGYFALMTTHGEAANTVLERVADAPLGDVLLAALAAGLFGYGLWRITGGVIDLDDEGRTAIGVVTRIGLVVSGLTHWLLCALALRLAWSGTGGTGQEEEQAAETAFTYPGGALLVGIVGAIIAIGGAGQWLIAIRGGYAKFLNARQPRFARFAGALGYGARGAVLIVVGWQVVAVASGLGDRALGFDSALEVIARRRSWIFPAIAAGLVLFGLFSLYAAAYLRIRDEDVKRRAQVRIGWWRRVTGE